MTNISTTGTKTCGMYALNGFTIKDQEFDEEWVKKGKSKESWEKELVKFKNKLVSTSQPDYHSNINMPFGYILETLNNSYEGPFSVCRYQSLKRKAIILVVNEEQRTPYWIKRFRKYDFVIADKFENLQGKTNYLYIRNPKKVKK